MHRQLRMVENDDNKGVMVDPRGSGRDAGWK